MNNYDVTSSFTEIVDTEPTQAREVLAQIDPMRSLADRLSALGLDDRAIWSQTDELSYTLIWRFGADGHAKLDWQITVASDGRGRTVLALKLSGRGSEPAARSRTLSSWTLLEELAQAHTRRLARLLDDYANSDSYSVAPAAPLRAVV